MAIDWTISRRGVFYGGFAALAGALGFSQRGARANLPFSSRTLISAARIDDTDGGALLCDEGVCPFALPARAHGATKIADSQHVVLVGRRPGKFAAIVDSGSLETPPRLFAPLDGYR